MSTINNLRGELELRRTRLWHILPSYAHSFRAQYEDRVFNRNGISEASAFVKERHSSGWFALKSNGYQRKPITAPVTEEQIEGVSNDLVLTDDPEYDMTQHWWQEEGPLISPDDEFINIIDLRSSVTRNGSWCSSGSIQHREQMIFASQFPNCIGHIFIIDTPGGSAYSRNDYEQGIAAARAAGQPVISWIDGLCASAGVAASVQTDEIYVQHPNCEYGCIGTMAAFYTIADGTKDEEGYTYHELYDPESYEKNLEYRELANKDNPDPILEELAKDGADFRALVKACRPKATDDMLHGKVFRASEVMDIFIDGVKTFDQVVDRILELRGGAPLIDHTFTAPEPTQEENPEPTPLEEPEEEPKNQTTVPEGSALGDNNSQTNMTQYENINAALEVEALAVTADGSFYCNGPLAEKLEAKLGEAKQNADLLTASNETVATLNAKVNELKAQAEQVATAHAEEKTALEAEVELLKSQLAEQTANAETSAKESADFGTKVADLEAQIATLKEEKAALETQIAEKQTEIEELSKISTPAATPTPAEPEQEHKEDTRSLVQPIYNESMTPEEKAKAREERMAYLKSIR